MMKEKTMNSSMNITNFPYCISLNKLEFPVLLGATASEQAQPQHVSLYIKIFFAQIPDGTNDDKGNYLCYDELAKIVLNYVNNQTFHLIEYLTMQIYNKIREHINQKTGIEIGSQTKIWLKLSKTPPVSYKIESTSFEYTDLYI